jgi:hypothetical protein
MKTQNELILALVFAYCYYYSAKPAQCTPFFTIFTIFFRFLRYFGPNGYQTWSNLVKQGILLKKALILLVYLRTILTILFGVYVYIQTELDAAVTSCMSFIR